MPTYQDVSRHTTNVINDPDISKEIWADAIEGSFFMKHARKINLPGNGVKIQTITGEPAADWVDETNPKPVSNPTFGTKTIIPYKLAVIVPFSNEFVRDKRKLYDALVDRLPGALATKFDSTILGTTAPGSGFDVLGTAAKVSLNPGEGQTMYGQLLAAEAAIAAANGTMDVIGLAPAGKTKVQGATDANGYPLFMQGVGENAVGGILGAQVDVNKRLYVPGTPSIVGIAGDFTEAVVGVVDGISIDVSREATIVNGDTTINLWQRNMVGVRAEMTVGFAVKSVNEFVLFTGDNAQA